MDAESTAMLKAIYEGQQVMKATLHGIEKRLDGIEARLDSLEARMESLEQNVEVLNVTTTAMKDQLVEMTHRDRYFMRKLGELEAEISVVRQRQDTK